MIEEIDPKYFKEKQVLTFEAHKFSVYSIAYKDVRTNSGSGSSGRPSSGNQDQDDPTDEDDKDPEEDDHDSRRDGKGRF